MVKYETIGNRIYFTCKKSKTISEEQSPSYGPIVKLKRIGHHGRIISIYKFRTMYPFSEFIQKDVFEENNLDASGKFLNDFRITSWGRILQFPKEFLTLSEKVKEYFGNPGLSYFYLLLATF